MIVTTEGRKSLDIPATLEEYSNMAGQIFCCTASLVACYMVIVLYGMTMVSFKEWTNKMANCKINFAARLSLLSHANE